MPYFLHPASCQSARRLNARLVGVYPGLTLSRVLRATRRNLPGRIGAGVFLLGLALFSGCAATPQDRGPEFVRGEGLVYPEDAKARGIEGYVVVEYGISESGEVVSPRVVASDPAGIFDAAALQAVAGWHYRPQVKDGAFVETPRVRSRVNFKLSGAAPYANFQKP